MDETRRKALEAALCRRARELDLGALLTALAYLGYQEEDLLFESNPDPGSTASFIQAVRFERSPRPLALITLNAGLTGSRGALPSYFEQVAEASPDPDVVHRFLQFFDHVLLRDFARAVEPERYPPGRWYRVRDAYFALLGHGSRSTLTWLFGLFFPELGVEVRRTDIQTRTHAHAVVLGQSRLDGSTVLGSTHDAGRAGFEVALYADDERNAAGLGWWDVVRERLHRHVVPLLGGHRITLTVMLVVQDHESWARLVGSGQLGYDRLRGTPGDHYILIHRGEVE